MNFEYSSQILSLVGSKNVNFSNSVFSIPCVDLANSTQNEPAKMVNETNGSNSTRNATGKKVTP